MPEQLTPGVYFQATQPARPSGSLVRADVAAFLGYARRGPGGAPVRVESWRQYLAVFDTPYAVGHLAGAVKGFFENGGRTCYIMRITDDGARPASLDLVTALGYRWRVSASVPLGRLTAGEADGERPDATGPLLQAGAGGQTLARAPDPGAWANQLAVSLYRRPLANTWTRPGLLEEGYVTEVESLAGLEAHSVVELVEPGEDETDPGTTAVLEIERIDALRGRVVWRQSLREAGLDPERALRLESVELTVEVTRDNRIVERFASLGVHPEHGRALTRVVNEASNYLEVRVLPPPEGERPEDYVDPGYWPPVVARRALAGGSDGLTGIEAAHYLAALGALERVEDVGLLAAPDLVLHPPLDHPATPPPPVETDDCQDTEPPPAGSVYGRLVTQLEGEEAETPLAGVTVTFAAGGRQVRTGANGEFRLEGIQVGLITLRLDKAGFAVEEQLTESRAVPSLQPNRFFLAPLLLPPALDETSVLEVQTAMSAQGEAGLYRVALLDPPASEMRIEEINAWRAKLGDGAYAALFYPWLHVPALAGDGGDTAAGELRELPPSGHIAGLIARTDLAEGVHRAAANFPLRYVKDVAVPIDDARQALLNPIGVNCIRQFPGRGIRPFGARTLSSEAEWRYLNVRRLVIVLEKTLEKLLQWAVFESNTAVLRQAVRLSIGALLERLWRQGALAGTRPEAAYRVKCDADNNHPAVRDAGRLIAEVAVAPSVPFEFITFRLGRTLDALEVTE